MKAFARSIANSTALRPVRARLFPGSPTYWERRYRGFGDSGAGSYGFTSRFKADSLNSFVEDRAIESVIEFGCGDGHQLTLASYRHYIGLDISPSAIKLCDRRFKGDVTKSFLAYMPNAFVNRGALQADLAISLDVILHLVEDDLYEKYMHDLFAAARRYVAIFAPNENRTTGLSPHVRFREFTAWVSEHATDWRLERFVENPGKGRDSLADMYFFKREGTSP